MILHSNVFSQNSPKITMMSYGLMASYDLAVNNNFNEIPENHLDISFVDKKKYHTFKDHDITKKKTATDVRHVQVDLPAKNFLRTSALEMRHKMIINRKICQISPSKSQIKVILAEIASLISECISMGIEESAYQCITDKILVWQN
jgi:hypothetical protein